ncbi:redox-regulated molecular chaperone Hsp33 [Mergibacter septicus]|uniref:33 kDa chaperonin n=1 Tax=Mergibacter septicus TaxID=221402 RepID=A0A8E3MDU6_9PAST|nr:Hsp33 family molecular chaperone HslO [Mergibacter septicus]AWX14843.1 redox-regulated molecular chaperone Hsp33 [Mergibacter septicus]QDJ13481.1 redox-regulated molecular chaperone Hsp33 [Mergibacter septicus]QDJ14095.1 redox-regulated molecular chaperone Hsp33 [Mergibacter septicus]UTU48455.1 Hsp33 family molecular chaperone HslO [Mergibacter septicus]WMR95916.1 Hsp33 family molecular chaperone HslO [Mergibacter septicus]
MQNYIQDNDKLYRYLFQHRAARGEWVRLNQTFSDSLNTHQYPTVVQNLLGEMLVATALLTATLKFKGDITLQIRGDGALSLALVNGNDQQQLRALARLKEETDPQFWQHATFSQLVGKAVLVISINPTVGERYQGIIALDKPTLAECLEDYFLRSEQLQTQLVIRSGQYQGQAVAAGMLVQIMPDGSGNEGDFEHLATLTATVKDDELFGLTAQELLYRLYHEETVEIYPAQETHFFCGCSQQRSEAALLLLSDQELEEIFAEKSSLDMQCECCGAKYIFTAEMIKQLKAVH